MEGATDEGEHEGEELWEEAETYPFLQSGTQFLPCDLYGDGQTQPPSVHTRTVSTLRSRSRE